MLHLTHDSISAIPIFKSSEKKVSYRLAGNRPRQSPRSGAGGGDRGHGGGRGARDGGEVELANGFQGVLAELTSLNELGLGRRR